MKGWTIAIVLVLASLTLYLSNDNHFSQEHVFVDNWDSGDYRYAAETFWHVAHDPATYGDDFIKGWSPYMDAVPFRGILPGSWYLALHGIIGFLYPAGAGNAQFMAAALCTSFQAFQVIAYLVFYAACVRRYGNRWALGLLCALVFPPHIWHLTQEVYLGEALLRPLFILMLSLLVYMGKIPSLRGMATFMALAFLCAQMKTQWSPLPLIVALAFAWGLYRYAVPLWRIWFVGLLALAVPFSVLLVNGLAWGDATLAPGAGLHAIRNSDGRYLDYVCHNPSADFAVLCDPARPKNSWWHVYTGPDAPPQAYRELDARVLPFYLRDPPRMAQRFYKGLALANPYPETAVSDTLAMRALSLLIWAVLCIGLWQADTAPLAAMGIGLWLIPAISNVFAPYGTRFYEVMAGIVLVLAVLIVLEKWWKEKKRVE